MINVFFKTYGCQANVADSEGLATYLSGLGCTKVEPEGQADLIMVNTCAVRDKAEHKMFSYLGELIEYKKKRPYLKIGVIGCVASYRKQEIYDRFDHVSFVFGAKEDMGVFQAYLADTIVSLDTTKQMYDAGVLGLFSHGQDRDIKGIVAAKNLTPIQHSVVDGGATTMSETKKLTEISRSYVNIMTGCDNYCSYCIVPFTRGREKSYEIQSIIDRVEHDVANGSKEITLIGQNVNSYKDPVTGAGFAALLEAVANIQGNFWVRYVSPHPKDMTPDVLDTMARYPKKLCSWVHFPLQAGSNTVLEAMKRTYTVERYMEQIGEIRARLPYATITTDIIVGFPGETDQDYNATLLAMEQVRYDNIFSFIYSPRKYTKAFVMGDPVSKEEKTARLERLQARHQEIAAQEHQKLIGTSHLVLVEKKLEHGEFLARTSGNIRAICLNGRDEDIGQFMTFVVNQTGPAQIMGSLIRET